MTLNFRQKKTPQYIEALKSKNQRLTKTKYYLYPQ